MTHARLALIAGGPAVGLRQGLNINGKGRGPVLT